MFEGGPFSRKEREKWLFGSNTQLPWWGGVVGWWGMGLVLYFLGVFYNEAALLLSTSCWNYATEKYCYCVFFFSFFLLAITIIHVL